MHASTKRAIIIINYLIFCLAETYGYFGSIPETSSAQGRKRATRQSGYVYDRPTISFNLPSRDIPVTSSTQASPVDRNVMQMYYAYPAPRGTALGVGTIAASGGGATSRENKGSSSATETQGYNYAAPNDVNGYGQGRNSQINQQISSVTTSGATLSAGGYKYGSQTAFNGGSSAPKIIQVGTASSLSSSGGYNYRTPDVVGNNRSTLTDRQSSSANDISNTAYGARGYKYSAPTNIVKANGGGSITSTESVFKTKTGSENSSGKTGYNYEKQNTATSQTVLQGDNAIFTDKSTGIDKFIGYNYEVQQQNQGATKKSNIPDRSGYSVKSPVQSMTTVSVSTNAPQYLPPKSSEDNISVLNNNYNVNSGATAIAQSDVYLPPAISNTPKIITTQTTPNVPPETNIVPSESYLPPPIPNTESSSRTKPVAEPEVYLPPVSINPSKVIETTSTSIQSSQESNAPTVSNLSFNPKNTYLQPNLPPAVSNEKMQISLSISNEPQIVPSINYLPPIPTSKEINQLVSTPAATYLPPVF